MDPGGRTAGDHRATFRPIATLSGAFDCGRQLTFEAQMVTSQAPGTTSIKQAPPKGATAMVVLNRKWDEDGYVVASAGCPFMPSGSAVEVVRGLDDPKVQQTVRRIQEARSSKRKPNRDGG